MADNKSRELTVKVNVDVSEAITGLKAVQREAKEATKALREFETEADKGEYKPVRASEYLTPKTDADIAEIIADHYPITVENAGKLLTAITVLAPELKRIYNRYTSDGE